MKSMPKTMRHIEYIVIYRHYRYDEYVEYVESRKYTTFVINGVTFK
jgi:hypothetical protein